MKKIQIILCRGIDITASVLFGWILLALFFAGNMGKYSCKKLFAFGNKKLFFAIILLLGILFIFCSCKAVEKLHDRVKDMNYDRVVKICTAAFFVIQLYILYNIFFETGWDSGYEVVPAARILLNGQTMEQDIIQYFADYPNNLFLVNLYRVLLTINQKVGIFHGEYELLTIVIINLLIAWWSCYLVYRIGKRLLGNPYGFVGYLIAAVLIGFSPWSVICYSDPLVLFFPISLAALYLDRNQKRIIRCVLIVFGGYLGYQLKPQAVIIVVAMAIVEGLRIGSGRKTGDVEREDGEFPMRKKENRAVRRQILTGFGIALCLILLVHFSLQHLYAREGFAVNSERQLGITHFLMMGMNPKSNGVWNGNDVTFSQSFETRAERRAANLEVAGKRLEKYGVTGYLQMLTKKMLTNYDDGTFAWDNKGSFYLRIPENVNTAIAGRLKSVYYQEGAHFQLFATPVQFIWLSVLTLIGLRTAWCAAARKKRRKEQEEERIYTVLILSLIGLTVFELLFEARARYLYAYAPIYVLTALYGLRDLCRFAQERKPREKKRAVLHMQEESGTL